MNTSHTLAIALATIASFQNISIAGDLFDSPGPGYRQQSERIDSFRVHVGPAIIISPSLHSADLAFSQPIHISMSPQQIPSGLSLGAPTEASPKNSK